MSRRGTSSGNSTSSLTISTIHFEHYGEALGIGTDRPRLSWIVETGSSGWCQAGYEIECFDADGKPRGHTGRVESDQSVLVDWPFAPLESRERANVRVRAWGTDGSTSEWSEPACVEAGLLQAQDWTASFVTPVWDEDTGRPQRAPMLRREYSVRAGLAKARLYITALGVYEARINGLPVGDHVLEPGWTSYNHRLQYQTFDVTPLLREGRNAIGAMLGDGWYRGRLGYGGGRGNIYGNRLALLAQLELTYADGTNERIVTDETWRAETGPILSSDIYDGETYDARLERPGWSTPGYNDGDWRRVALLQRDLRTLVAPTGPPVRRTQEVAPIAIFKSPSGRTVVDFGQNLVGKVRVSVNGGAGQTITLRHAEVLENGELAMRPLRTAEATDRYTLRGDGPETWEPAFTFHGFRYAEVEGWPGELRPEDISAVVLHSDLERTGWFECSDPLINRLHENVIWSMRGNFLSIPTDCPQRDERLGWTGDLQVFTPTASFLYDTAGFLQSWLGDLAAEQKDAGGVVPVVVPDVLPEKPVPTAAWGDAAVMVPWTLYERYGDEGILAAQLESMRSWVDLIAGVAGERRLWEGGFQFGDWLDPSAPSERPSEARTDPYLIATAYFARSAELVGRAAGVLGRAEDEARYLTLAAEIREAFGREYVTPAGRTLSDAATAYALAIQFGLLPDGEQRRHAGDMLAHLVRASGYHISTGFVGTPLICDALCAVGHLDAAYRLLMQRDCPSWLYAVTMGATTIWERWDSLLPDGSINPGEMTSFNHYAFGAVADWLHRTVAGLAPAEPGYRRIEFRPQPGGGLSSARARHKTPYGIAECAWAIEAGSIEVQVMVPPNTTAVVALPGRDTEPFEVGSGEHRWFYPYQVPEPARKHLTIDSTLGEIIDDTEAWAATLAAIRASLPEFNVGEFGTRRAVIRTVREILDHHPHKDKLLRIFSDTLAGLDDREGSTS
jgi:alpha-L-rhamnosidase